MDVGASCAIAVMGKVPVPGRSKTRLCPPLNHDQAASLSEGFLRDMFGNIQQAGQRAAIAGYAAFAPASGAAAMAALLPRDMHPLLADGTPPMPDNVQGLGRSLLHAMRGLFDLGHPAACLLNSDSPTLPTEYLVRAARTLMEHEDRVVLGPAEDGGYYLIGMRRPHAALFADIAWSTETVARSTRHRAAELGLDLVELPSWYDVDETASLSRLILELAAGPSGAYRAPATRSVLHRLGLALPPASVRSGEQLLPALPADGS